MQGQRDALKAQYSELLGKLKMMTNDKSAQDSFISLQVEEYEHKVKGLEQENQILTNSIETLNLQIDAIKDSHKIEIRILHDQTAKTIASKEEAIGQ